MKQPILKPVRARNVNLLAEVYEDAGIAVLVEPVTYKRVAKVETTEMKDLRSIARKLAVAKKYIDILNKEHVKFFPDTEYNLHQVTPEGQDAKPAPVVRAEPTNGSTGHLPQVRAVQPPKVIVRRAKAPTKRKKL